MVNSDLATSLPVVVSKIFCSYVSTAATSTSNDITAFLQLRIRLFGGHSYLSCHENKGHEINIKKGLVLSPLLPETYDSCTAHNTVGLAWSSAEAVG